MTSINAFSKFQPVKGGTLSKMAYEEKKLKSRKTEKKFELYGLIEKVSNSNLNYPN